MRKKYFFIISILVLILVYVSNITQIPSNIFLIDGEKFEIKTIYGINIAEVKKDVKETWQSKELETSKLEVSLFGNIKVKEVSVTKYPSVKVIPTGNLVGLKLYTNGVLVIGTTEVKDVNNKIEKPYENTNIKEGDTILEVDNQEIDSTKTLQNVINNSNGKSLDIKYSRNGEIYTSNITPSQTGTNEYRLGLWVRDSASGVGTMAFYEPETRKFVALGHGISDGDTGELLDIGKGEMVNSKIVNITKGKKGFPGEIRGSIANQSSIGEVTVNTDFGIFGTLNEDVCISSKHSDGVEVALRDEITLGEASILTTVGDEVGEEFKVEIVSIDRDNDLNNKSMQIKITDERLLEKTGGIICGMSGSPIIQNGKLVGALTNVLVSDPQFGYGVFADIMLKNLMRY